MADYDAGRAFLQIVPSFRGVRESIKRQAKQWADDVEDVVAKALPEGFAEGAKAASVQAKSRGKNAGEEYGGAFARTVRTRIEAALKALPKVKVDADSSLADIKLAAIRAELEDLGKQRIGVDVDDAVALAQLERLSAELNELGAGSTSVDVRVDTATASAELDKLVEKIRALSTSQPTVQVDADTAVADAQLAATKAEADDLGRSRPSVTPDVKSDRALVGIGVIRAALAALVGAPIVIPIAVAGASLLGPLSAAGAGAVGFGAVAAPGLARIHTALQAQDNQRTGGGRSGASQVSQANSIRLAQLGLADAQHQVAVTARENAQAQAQAAEQVRQAEQSLVQAQQQSRLAQQELNQARADARRQLEDLADSLTDAQLAERRGTLSLKQAQDNLKTTLADPHATADQKTAAQLAVDEAQQALAEQQKAVRRLAADKKAADKAGVNGTQQVQAAERRLAETRQTIADRQRALAKARADQEQTEQRNAEKTRQAQEQVLRAQLSLQSAQAAAAASASSAAASTSKLDKAMANLTPTERNALGAFRDFGKAYRAWVSALEPSVFPAITGGLGLIQTLFKPLTPIVQAASGAFVHLEGDARKALTSPFWKNALDTLGKLTGPSIVAFGHIVGNILTGLAGIGLALSPTGGGILSGLEHLSQRFADFGKHASEPGGFQTVLTWVRDQLPKIRDWFEDVGKAIGHLGLALAPIGGYVLGGIQLLANVIDHIPPTLLGAIAVGFLAIAAGVRLWATATSILVFWQSLLNLELAPFIILIGGLALALVYAWRHFGTFKDVIVTSWAFVKKALSEVAGFIKKYFIAPFLAIPEAIGRIWNDIKGAFVAGINGVIDLINAFLHVINRFFRGFVPTQKIQIPDIQHIGGPRAPARFASAGGGGGGIGGGSHATVGLALGGVIPGYAPGIDSVHAMLSPGEAVLVPEAVRALGADWVLAINRMFSGRRPGRGGAYAGGGIIGDITKLIPNPASVIPGIGSPASVFARPIGALEDRLRQRADLEGNVGLAAVHQLSNALTRTMDHIWKTSPTGGGPLPVGDAVGRWAGVVAEALALLGQPQGLVNAVLQLIKFESGGNPAAVNLTDINARRGTPSVGLAQVIGPTFRGNAGPYLNTGPFAYGVSMNPLANIYAGLHYGIGRYGSIANIPGIKSLLAGGPYLPYDEGGYLPPGMSTVINGTGRPEPVLTDAQWRTLAAGAGRDNGPTRITGTLDLGDGLTGYIDAILDDREHQQARQVTNGRRSIAV